MWLFDPWPVTPHQHLPCDQPVCLSIRPSLDKGQNKMKEL